MPGDMDYSTTVRTNDAPTLPQIGSLLYPADGGRVEGCGLLFRWEFAHLGEPSPRCRLVIKRRRLDQSSSQAMRENDAVFEHVIDHVSYAALSTASLKEPAATYVWQVTALGDSSEEG